MPEHMKALVFHGDRDLRYEDVPLPAPETEEVLVRMGAVGICGSDVHGYLGKTGRRTPPMIMGHETAGIVARTGSRVTSLSPGQPVAVFPYSSCGACACCREGATALCPDRRMLGVFDVNGGMAEYVLVPQQQVIPLPEGADPVHAALAEPLSVALHGIEKSGMTPGTRLLIVGAGAIGLMCLVLARQRGTTSTTVLDIADDRLDLAKRMGAERVIRGSGDMAVGAFDVVVEAVGVAATLNQSVQLAARGGKVIVLGMTQRDIPLDVFDIVAREIRLEGSFNYSFAEFESVVRMLPALQSHIEPVISHRVPLDCGGEMFRRLAMGETGMHKVILTGNAGDGGGTR